MNLKSLISMNFSNLIDKIIGYKDTEKNKIKEKVNALQQNN